MNANDFVVILQESLYWIIVFGSLLGFSMIRGIQSLKNLILSLYLALLISLEFPYYDSILSGTDANKTPDSVLMLIIFGVFTIMGMFLFGKLMPRDYEKAFDDFHKKLLFALMGSILIMAYSYHALPITDILTPGSPVQSLFGPEQHFFWWLMLPLVVLLFL